MNMQFSRYNITSQYILRRVAMVGISVLETGCAILTDIYLHRSKRPGSTNDVRAMGAVDIPYPAVMVLTLMCGTDSATPLERWHRSFSRGDGVTTVITTNVVRGAATIECGNVPLSCSLRIAALRHFAVIGWMNVCGCLIQCTA